MSEYDTPESDLGDIASSIDSLASSVSQISTSIDSLVDGAFRIGEEFLTSRPSPGPTFLPAQPGDVGVTYHAYSGGWSSVSLPVIAWEIGDKYVQARFSDEPHPPEGLSRAATVVYRNDVLIYQSHGRGLGLGNSREKAERYLSHRYNWRDGMLQDIQNSRTLDKLDEQSEFIDTSQYGPMGELDTVDFYRRLLANWDGYPHVDTDDKIGEGHQALRRVLVAYVEKYDELKARETA